MKLESCLKWIEVESKPNDYPFEELYKKNY